MVDLKERFYVQGGKHDEILYKRLAFRSQPNNLF